MISMNAAHLAKRNSDTPRGRGHSMGGYGSGKLASKELTTAYRQLDVRELARSVGGKLQKGAGGVIEWTNAGGEKIGSIALAMKDDYTLTLAYAYNGEDAAHDVQIERTRCHLGGERAWFRCPSRDCGRRCAILYGGRYFVCRECRNLSYPSQRRTPGSWEARRARLRTMLRQLEAKGAEVKECQWRTPEQLPPPSKPKGMHWSTYSEWVTEYRRESDAVNQAWVSHVGDQFGHIESFTDALDNILGDD